MKQQYNHTSEIETVNQSGFEDEIRQMMKERKLDYEDAVNFVFRSYDPDFLESQLGFNYYNRIQQASYDN